MRVIARRSCSIAILLLIAISVAAADATAACVYTNPQLVITPASSPSGVAGRLEQFTVSLTNLNSADCGTSDFLLNVAPPATLPNGWTIALLTSSFSLAPGETGTTALQVRSPANAPPSSYAVTVTGLNWPMFTFRTDAIATYVVNSVIVSDFAIAAAPPAVSVQRSSAGTVTVSTTVSGGFSSSLSLSVSGLPNGVTSGFSVPGFAAPGSGSATLTLTANSTADLGTFSVVVTGTAGAVIHSANVSLTVTDLPPVLTSIVIAPADPSVPSGTPQQFLATGLYSNNSTQNLTSQVTWSSSNSAVALIGATGLAITFATGTTTIGAALNAISGNTLLTVTRANVCVHQPPLLQINPASSPSGPPGRLESYTVSLTNQDNALCDPSDFLMNTTPPTILPDGWTITLVQNSFSLAPGQTGTTTLQITSPNTATGPASYDIQVTGRNWPVYTLATTELATYVVNSVVVPDFNVAATPATLSVQRGGTATTAVNTAVFGGFNAAVSLSASGLPSGVSAGFSPTGFAAPGSGSSTLTLTAASNASLGLVNVTITATSGADTRSTTLALTVTDVAPTLLAIAVTPSDASLPSGSPQQFLATGLYSNSSTLDLTNQVTWGSTTLSVATINSAGLASTLSPGSTTISATLGAVSGSTQLTVTLVGGCTLAPPPVVVTPPASPSGPAGRLEQYTVSITNQNSAACDPSTFLLFANPPLLLPDGWTISLVNSSFTLAPGQTVATTLQVRSPNSASDPIYYLTVTAINWPMFSYRTDVQVQYLVNSVVVPDFTISAPPNTITVQRGSSGTLNITSAISGGFSQPVSLAVSGLPSGVTAGFNPNAFGAPGSGTSVLTLTANGTATLGQVNITITGTAGAETQTTTVALTVTGLPPTLSAIAVTPTDLSVITGTPVQFQATGLYSNNSTQDLTNQVTWGSSNSTVASIGAGGLAGTLAAGTSTISATLGAISGSTLLTVTSSVACVRANPTVSVTPPQSAPGAAGRLEQYTVLVTNNDSAECGSSTFLMQVTAPTDTWNVVLVNTSFSLPPGQTGTTTLQVRSPADALSGSYDVAVRAVNWPIFTFGNTGSAKYVIQ